MNRKKMVRSDMVPRMMLIIAVALFLADPGQGGQSISARYTQPRGNQIAWKIRIPYPAPAAVLVTQYILPDSDILASSHPMNSYDKKKGIAKWLITPISPGVLKMEMTVSKPIQQKGEIHGEIMFQDESQRTTASIFMEPKTVKKAFEGC